MFIDIEAKLYKERAQNGSKSGGDKTTKNGRNNDQNRNKDNTKKIFKHGAIVGISVGVTGIIISFLTILINICIRRRRSNQKKRRQLTRLQSVDQRTNMRNRGSFPSSSNIGGHNCLLDPLVPKHGNAGYYQSRLLPEVKRFSVAQGDEKVSNESDEDKIESPKDMNVDQKKQIEEVRDIVIYHSDLTNNKNQLGFDNTTNNVTPEVGDQIY
ncbi:unnamed protein product [Mytilus coruscus]|uniref:Uncharacterized protein n=1 Tax=Mytilus coruscus TaxID=42192 RepID=A0A6J8EDR5_MYTCO|nr:unnamed protein product [Mytilus coruscus]